MDKENPKPKTILETLIEMNRSYSSGVTGVTSVTGVGPGASVVASNMTSTDIVDKWTKYVNLFEKMVFNALPGMCLVEKNNISRKYKDAEEEIYIEYRFKGDPSRQYCQVTYTDEGVVVFQKRKQTPKKIYKSFTKFLEDSDYI